MQKHHCCASGSLVLGGRRKARGTRIHWLLFAPTGTSALQTISHLIQNNIIMYIYIYIYSALSLPLFLCPILSILQPLFLSIIPSPFLLCPLSFALSFPPSCCLSISLSLSLYMALSLSLPVSLSPSLSSLVSCSLCFSLSLFLSSVSVCPSLFPLPLSGCCITLGCIGSKKLVVHPAPEGEKQSRVRSSAAEGCSVLSGSEGTMATIRKMICSTEYLVNCLRHPRGQPKAGAWH